MRWGRMLRGSCLRWLQEVIGRGAGGACLGAANLGGGWSSTLSTIPWDQGRQAGGWVGLGHPGLAAGV